MRHDILALPNRRHLAGLSLIYAGVMLYSSTLVGPTGVNFVYRDPADALRIFLATPYVAHGSDQRADWIGNLLMLVPYGFLVVGAMWPRRSFLRPPAALGAMLVCVATILAIKYLQLFFPPRTVTLNYILAQTLGAVIGCVGYAVWHGRVGPVAGRRDHIGGFVLLLRLYTGALCLFTLMPLDFALNASDLGTLLDRLPKTVVTLPGNGRPLAVRVMLIVMASLAFIPVGMLLTFVGRGVHRVGRGLLSVTGLGLLLTAGLYGLSVFVISAYPAAPSILYRTAGIVVGAAALSWLVRQDTDALRQRLVRLAPWAIAPYLLAVLLVNRLLSTHWLSASEAIAQFYPPSFLPLFDYYIVTKAEAAKNIVGHAALYLPVGVLLWLRYGDRSPMRAFILAAALSFVVELARSFRPGLEGDMNAIVVGGVASACAAALMPTLWSMVQTLGRQSAARTNRLWGTPGGSGSADGTVGRTADIEHY